jgi:hypothetical protein
MKQPLKLATADDIQLRKLWKLFEADKKLKYGDGTFFVGDESVSPEITIYRRNKPIGKFNCIDGYMKNIEFFSTRKKPYNKESHNEAV